jgi:bifunctional UDP-N-acetylglucosamine pyrophosphorylase / glucosamine-1-phosphate N-acetyltransferase
MAFSHSPTNLFEFAKYPHASLFSDCKYAWHAFLKLTSYLETQVSFEKDISIPSTVYLDNAEQIAIGKGSIIEPGAYIRGPCVIGMHCIIRHGAYIRGHVITGNRCVIGHASEIKHAILFHGVTCPHFNYVGDSILGNDVHLGAGVICANLRLDQKTISARIDGKRVDTGLKKLGSILGDGVQVGCHTVLNPGTILGKEAICYPNLNVSGTFEHGAVIKCQM